MANPFPGSVQLSSAGVSPALMLDPLARVTQLQLSFSSSAATIDLTVQGTLDVEAPQLVGQTQFWDNISTTHYSTAVALDGVNINLLCPIAGLRLSSSTWTAGVATLKVLQLIMG